MVDAIQQGLGGPKCFTLERVKQLATTPLENWSSLELTPEEEEHLAVCDGCYEAMLTGSFNKDESWYFKS